MNGQVVPLENIAFGRAHRGVSVGPLSFDQPLFEAARPTGRLRESGAAGQVDEARARPPGRNEPRASARSIQAAGRGSS